MKFTLHTPASSNVVYACTAEEIILQDRVIRTSVILSATEIIPDWPPTRIEELLPQHLQAALRLQPDVILLGTGAQQVFPDAALMAEVLSAGIGFEVMDTPAACRTYNILIEEGRRVAAALILGSTAGAIELVGR
jgi:uncharacterized protein